MGDIDFFRIAVSGAGFLADAYDLFVINLAVDMMAKVSYKEILTDDLKSNVKTMALIGAVVGQLVFGATADLIGRRIVFIITCTLVICGAILSASAQDTSSFGIYSQLCLWRFILGVGVGGEYPLSAAITSESASIENKSKCLAMVFSMQGFGSLLCTLVLVTVSQTLVGQFEAQWRIALGLGGLPMILAFYFRWTMHESKQWENKPSDAVFRTSIISDSKTNQRVSVFEYFSSGFNYVQAVVRRNHFRLLGTAGAWFILDIVFYANSLFSGQITKSMGLGSTIQAEALTQLILQVIHS
jgi:PHS family inorganic phosphate transporter-like MFS transporter